MRRGLCLCACVTWLAAAADIELVGDHSVAGGVISAVSVSPDDAFAALGVDAGVAFVSLGPAWAGAPSGSLFEELATVAAPKTPQAVLAASPTASFSVDDAGNLLAYEGTQLDASSVPHAFAEVGRVSLGYGCTDLALDENNFVWLVCEGNRLTIVDARNPSSMSVSEEVPKTDPFLRVIAESGFIMTACGRYVFTYSPYTPGVGVVETQFITFGGTIRALDVREQFATAMCFSLQSVDIDVVNAVDKNSPPNFFFKMPTDPIVMRSSVGLLYSVMKDTMTVYNVSANGHVYELGNTSISAPIITQVIADATKSGMMLVPDGGRLVAYAATSALLLPTETPKTVAPDTEPPKTSAPVTAVPTTQAPQTLVATGVPAPPPTSQPSASLGPAPPPVNGTAPQQGRGRAEILDHLSIAGSFPTAATIGAAATLSASSGSSVARMVLVIQSCASASAGGEVNLPFALHPLQVRMFGSHWVGAALGNVGVCLTCLLVNYALARLLRSCGPRLCPSLFTPATDFHGLLRFPSNALFAYQILYQGIALSAVLLVVHPRGVFDFVLGVSTLLTALLVPLAVVSASAGAVPDRAEYVVDPQRTGYLAKMMLGSGEWVSTARGDLWAHRYAAVLRPFRRETRGYFVVECAASLGLACVESAAPAGPTGCGHVKLLSSLVFWGLLLAEYGVWPRSRPRDAAMNMVLHGVQGVGLALMASALYSNDEGAWMGNTAGSLFETAFVLAVAKGAVDLCCEAYGAFTGRRRALQQESFDAHSFAAAAQDRDGLAVELQLFCDQFEAWCDSDAPPNQPRDASAGAAETSGEVEEKAKDAGAGQKSDKTSEGSPEESASSVTRASVAGFLNLAAMSHATLQEGFETDSSACTPSLFTPRAHHSYRQPPPHVDTDLSTPLLSPCCKLSGAGSALTRSLPVGFKSVLHSPRSCRTAVTPTFQTLSDGSGAPGVLSPKAAFPETEPLPPPCRRMPPFDPTALSSPPMRVGSFAGGRAAGRDPARAASYTPRWAADAKHPVSDGASHQTASSAGDAPSEAARDSPSWAQNSSLCRLVSPQHATLVSPRRFSIENLTKHDMAESVAL
ncbi:hypothetical protein DIPPA_08462 [Diplonema papillatum]|nr:hypothetical protein DIPPA_08462 [Diplonema papillatum]